MKVGREGGEGHCSQTSKKDFRARKDEGGRYLDISLLQLLILEQPLPEAGVVVLLLQEDLDAPG